MIDLDSSGVVFKSKYKEGLFIVSPIPQKTELSLLLTNYPFVEQRENIIDIRCENARVCYRIDDIDMHSQTAYCSLVYEEHYV